MKVILMILHLANGDVAKIPVTLLSTQTCNDKFIEMVKPNETNTSMLFSGIEVWIYYCQRGTGAWVP